jgi:YcaO-like protein with predicted kinase domain
MSWQFDPPPTADMLAGVLDHTTDHTLSAAAYWQRLRPMLQDFGISRVADITGLDTIGLPVVQAVRPAAHSNAVTQGKAGTLEGAAVGAVLECLEMAAGEAFDGHPVIPLQTGDLWSDFAPGLPDGTVWPDADTVFISCWNVSEDRPAALPRDLISTDFSQDAPAAAAPILRHSIGLGAGTTFASALLHGLLECIEADARTHAEAFGGMRRVALAHNDPVYGPVLRLIEAAGLRVLVEDMPCKGGVVAVKASVMEAPGATSLPLPATGYGARLQPQDAVLAALSEALQARLAVISGAREDITQQFYIHGASLQDLQAEWDRHGPSFFGVSLNAPASTALRTIAHAVGPVFAVPLYWNAALPIAIIRIVAPQLIADSMRLVVP